MKEEKKKPAVAEDNDFEKHTTTRSHGLIDSELQFQFQSGNDDDDDED